MVLLIKCNTKKRNPFFVKKTRKYLKKNRFLLLNKFKKRIWLQKTDRDLYFTGCGFIQTVGNLHFSTENYKKPSEISISPRRITKNWQKSPFLHRELQKTDRNLHFSTENCKKLTEISVFPQRIAKNRLRRAFLSLGIFINKRMNLIFYFFWRFLLKKTRNAWFCIYLRR